jgi:diadenylate cyclase
VDGKLYYDLSPIEVQRKLKELLDRGVRGGDSEPKTSPVDVAVGGTLDGGKDVFIER